MLGWEGGRVRPPLGDLHPELRRELRATLVEAGYVLHA